MEEKKVSVIIPVYNVEKYIRRCLDSIISQTYRNLEIIINNDGSTDSSYEICKEYAGKDGRIKLYSQNNKGLSEARNSVLKHVSGDYFLFVDSDDWLVNEAIEKLVGLKEKYNADCVAGGVEKVTRDSTRRSKLKIDITLFCGREFSYKMLRPFGYFCYAWGRLFDKKVLDYIHFPENYIFEDVFTMPMVIYNLEKVVRTSEPLYCYRFRRTGLSHSRFQRRSTDEMDAYLAVIRFAIEQDDFRLAKNAMIFFLTKYYWYFIKVLVTGIGIKEYRQKYKDYAKWLRIQLMKGCFVPNKALCDRELQPWR